MVSEDELTPGTIVRFGSRNGEKTRARITGERDRKGRYQVVSLEPRGRHRRRPVGVRYHVPLSWIVRDED